MLQYGAQKPVQDSALWMDTKVMSRQLLSVLTENRLQRKFCFIRVFFSSCGRDKVIITWSCPEFTRQKVIPTFEVSSFLIFDRSITNFSRRLREFVIKIVRRSCRSLQCVDSDFLFSGDCILT